MKKDYKKPTLYAECFQLVEHISKCNVATGITNVTYLSEEKCSYTDGNMTLFSSDANGCDMSWMEDGFYDGVEDYIRQMKDANALECYMAFSNGSPFAS